LRTLPLTLPLDGCCCLEAESVSFFEFVLDQEKINLQRLLTAVLLDRVLTSAPYMIVYMRYDKQASKKGMQANHAYTCICITYSLILVAIFIQ